MSYSNKVLDHYEHPRNVGSMPKEDPNVGTGLVGAPACGDVMKLQIRVNDSGVIEDAKFKTFGCGSAIASSSLITEWVKGRSVDEAMTIKNTEIAEHLSLPPVKIHCSVLAEDAIKAAIADYRGKRGAGGADASEEKKKKPRKTMAAPILSITDVAANRIAHLMKERDKPAAGVRVGIRTRGCSGLSYTFEYADAPGPGDEVVEAKGVRLLIDPKAVMFLIGTEMDFVEEKLKSGFVFRNPNEKGRCGCGESFHV